jgi:hypothetical protein
MIMVFAALTLLAMYLPTRAALQRATQHAAIAMATERSDTWLFFDESSMSYYWENDDTKLDSVYASLLKSFASGLNAAKAESIVINAEKNGVLTPQGRLSVEYGVVNHAVYREIVITATRTIPMPVDLSFIGFPREIPVTVTAIAPAPNGDEFLRNADLAAESAAYLYEKYGTTPGGLFAKIQEVADKIPAFLGI